jgi:hypothetical protein
MTTTSRRSLNRELCLPLAYVSRDHPDYYDDDDESDLIRQPDVYGLARILAQRLGASTLVDIGCGKATKLLQISDGFDTIGVDFGENIDFCRQAHPELRWEEIDLECISLEWLEGIPPTAVLICGDVIEHLLDPRPLLKLLRAATRAGMTVVMSTPDRSLIHPDGHLGPPALGAHVREWTCSEFRQLLIAHELPLAAIGWTRPSVGTDEASTILAIAVPNLPAPDNGILGVADGLLSPVHRSPHDHLEHARRLGYDSVEVTDPVLVLRGLEFSESRYHHVPICRPPVSVGNGGRGTYPFNLVAVEPGGSAEYIEACQIAVRRHLALALIGTDPSSEIWADASRRWLLHRENVLSSGFIEANSIRRDLEKQLDDLRAAAERTTTDLRVQLEDVRRIEADLRVQLEDLRRIETDLRWSHLALETELFGQIETLQKSITVIGNELELTCGERDQLRSVLDLRRDQLTTEAEQRMRTVPCVDRTRLVVPASYGPRRAGSAVARRIAALVHRMSSIPGCARLHHVADDIVASAVPSRSVPTWLFDADFYAHEFPPAVKSGVSAVAHYDMLGWRLGISPHPLFAAGWYLGNHADVRDAGTDPLRHFVEVGWALGYDPHPLFSVRWYLEHSPDVVAAGINPLEHYLVHGWREGRDPHPLFDTASYLRWRPDVATAGINPLVHYVLHGHRERTAPSNIFDPWFYAAKTPESVASILPQYWYYLEVGALCGDLTTHVDGAPRTDVGAADADGVA